MLPRLPRAFFFLSLFAFLGSWLAGQQPAAEGQQKKGKKDGPPPTAKELLATVKLPADLRATIFAQPPHVNYPTCLVAAPTGELFIGCDENSSLDAKAGRGRIVRCIDKDGDGVADEFTTFAELDSPRGLVWDAGKLYVLHPPNLSVFYDDDGDGKSDRSEALVKGIGRDLKFRGADHTTNGIQLGIDGYLYIAVGDYGFYKAVGKDGVPCQLYGGGVARVRADGTGLEVVSRGQRNIYDVAIDPFLNLFTRDNTNDGGGWDVRLSHVVHGGQYGYPSHFKNFPEDHLQPLADYGGGSPTGSLFVDEGALPAPYGNSLYTVEWGRQAIMRHPLTPNGASFKADQKSLLQIPHPTDMEVDASGRMYIASWRGGQYTYAGPNVGFVTLVTHKDFKPAPFPDLKKAKANELVDLIGASSQFTRLHAQREILKRGYLEEMATGLTKLAANGKVSAGRVAALFTLQQLAKGNAADALVRLAKDDFLRPFALRAMADDPTWTKGVPSETFVSALSDPSPRTRLEAISALGRLGRKDGIDKLLPLAGDADPVLAHVAVKNLVDLRAWEAALRGMQPGAPAKLLLGCSQVLQAQHDPAAVEGLIAKVDKTSDPEVQRYLLRALARLYHKEWTWDGKAWWGTRPDTKGPYFKITTWEQSPKILGALMKALPSADKAVQTSLVNEMRRNRIDLDGAVPLVLKLASTEAEFRPAAVEILLGRTKLPANAVKWLEEIALSSKEPPAVRAKTLLGLTELAAKGSNVLPTVAAGFAAIGDKAPTELAKAREEFLRDPRNGKQADFWAKEALAKEPTQRELAYAVFLSLTMNLQADPKDRDKATKAIDAGWTTPESTVSLLRAIGQTYSDHYGLQVRDKLKDGRPEVKAAAEFAAKLIELDAPIKNTGPVVGKLAFEDVLSSLGKEKGDAKLGARLFFKQGCVACHTVSAQEAPRGPFLADITLRYKQDELLESILKPSVKIAQGFETQWFNMADGKVFEGFVTREAGTEVEIRNLVGLATVLKKADIEQRGRRDTSMMPDRLVENLSMRELASLVAYLDTVRSKK